MNTYFDFIAFLATLLFMFVALVLFLYTCYRIFRWIFKERHHHHVQYITEETELDITVHKNQVIIRDIYGKLMDVVVL